MEKKKRIKVKLWEATEGERKRRARDSLFYFINSSLCFFFFSDLRKLDRRFSSGQKVKLIYAMRATRGYQNLKVSSNFTR